MMLLQSRHQRVRCAALPLPASARGFTLLELLVVVVIIGVIVSAATLSVGVLGGDRASEEEAQRIWAVVQQAREEAELQGIDVALFASAAAYEFLRYDNRQEQWVSISDDMLYRPRELPEGLRFNLRVDGRQIVLKPQLPDRSDVDEHKKWPPQIMVLSSGDIMPFEMQIERDGAEALWRVVALPDTDLRLERRGGERNWIMTVQTRAPDEATQRRASNAR